MNWMYLIVGIITVAILLYLFVAMFKPELFK